MDKPSKSVSKNDDDPGIVLEKILNLPNLPDDIKVDFVSGAMQKAMETGNNSALDLTSPTTKTLSFCMDAVDTLLPSPEKRKLRRKLVYDWKGKKDQQLLEASKRLQQDDQPPVKELALK